MPESYAHIVRMLGLSIYSQEFREILEPVIQAESQLIQIEQVQHKLRQKGLSLLHVQEVICGILFHVSSDVADILPYVGALPFNLDANDNEETAGNKVGLNSDSSVVKIGKFVRRVYLLPDWRMILEFDYSLRHLKSVVLLRMDEVELSML